MAFPARLEQRQVKSAGEALTLLGRQEFAKRIGAV
jgi:hypothetical protein